MIKKITLVVVCLIITTLQIKAQSNKTYKIADDIQLFYLEDSVYIHTSWLYIEEYGNIPANGLLIVQKGQAIIIDTPWNNDQTKRLTEYLKDSMNVEVKRFIAGHYHEDCMGGLEYLQNLGVESIANSLTINKCKDLQLPVPTTSFTDSLILDFNGLQIECRFFGGGHTFDNITVWIPGKEILFGGCLVKSFNSTNLGNTREAVLEDWETTIEKILNKYPRIKTVVPGHGKYGGTELLTHTIQLVKEQKAKH